MRNRTLSLKKETLAELASDDLRAVAGGSVGPTCVSCATVCGVCDPRLVPMIVDYVSVRGLCEGLWPIPPLG